MSHEQGCPCNGFGGCYATCTCAEIITRNNTAALDRHTEALREAARDQQRRIDDHTESLAERFRKTLTARVMWYSSFSGDDAFMKTKPGVLAALAETQLLFEADVIHCLENRA